MKWWLYKSHNYVQNKLSFKTRVDYTIYLCNKLEGNYIFYELQGNKNASFHWKNELMLLLKVHNVSRC